VTRTAATIAVILGSLRMAQWRTSSTTTATGGAQLLPESRYKVELTRYVRTVWARTVMRRVYWRQLTPVGYVELLHGRVPLAIASASTTIKKKKT